MGEVTREDMIAVVRDAVAADEHPVSPAAEPPASPPAEPQIGISATPFVWREPATIPRRAWLYGKHYIRKFLTCTVGLGGGGKTSALIVEALAMATGRPLLGIKPVGRARVWIWNGEDPAEELDRRIIAAMIQHDVKPEDVEGYLFRDTGREVPLVVATQSRHGTIVARPVVDAIIAEIKRKQIDVLIVDPFIKSHKVIENDNNAIDQVASEWAAVADACNCSVELSHHSRKTGGNEVTIDDVRGAVALVNAARSARVLNKMTEDQAKNAFLEEATAWRYFQIDNGKANMAPPAEKAQWYRLGSVALANGDNVGAATAWTWPNAFEGVNPHELRMAQQAVSAGGPWRENHQAKMWVGIPIAAALGLDPVKDRKRILTILATWIQNEMFVVVSGKGENRHETSFVEVGKRADT